MTTPVPSSDSSSLQESAAVRLQGAVTTDDLVQGCQKYLASIPEVTGLLGMFEDSQPWLFQHKLHVVVETSQSAALVLTQAGGWGSPNDHNTMAFPRLSVELWVDPIRDEDRNCVEFAETMRRLDLIYSVVNRHLHRPSHRLQMWGTVRTLGCTRLAEPLVYPIPDGDGALRALVMYGVVLG